MGDFKSQHKMAYLYCVNGLIYRKGWNYYSEWWVQSPIANVFYFGDSIEITDVV